MARKSYRQHRAERTAALSDDGTDLDSLASFSTLASHTTFSSQQQGGYTSYSSFSSAPHNGTSSNTPNSYYSGLAPPGVGGIRQRTYSNVSSLSRRDASVDTQSGGPAGPSSFQRRLSPAPSDLPTPSGLPPSPASRTSRQLSGEDDTKPAMPKTREDRDRDRRRRRARNEERWRRARAREAAHDAPVRRLAKAANNVLGPQGTMVAALVAAFVVRLVLTAGVLWLDDAARLSAVREAGWYRRTCTGVEGGVPLLYKPLLPLCRAVFVPRGDFHIQMIDNENPGALPILAVVLLRLGAESVLWSAGLAWAVVEGWREGRTLRTKVAAIVYLVLAPVLAISDAAFLPVRGALGFVAWALLAATSGYDDASAMLLTTAVWFESSTAAYIPSFAVYAVGKRIWLTKRGRGYLAHLIAAIAITLAVLYGLSPTPMRVRMAAVVACVKSMSVPSAKSVAWRVASFVSLRNVLSAVALGPSTYLTLKSSLALRPGESEAVSRTSVPATARLLPIAMTASAGALAVYPADPVIPLLPLAFASALRRDDDEWAMAVQAQHIAAMALWPRLCGPVISLASGYVLAWNMIIGAGQDAPNPLLRTHQKATFVANFFANVVPLFAPLNLGNVSFEAVGKYLGYLHTVFVTASLVAIVLWANTRLVKTAWAVGAL